MQVKLKNLDRPGSVILSTIAVTNNTSDCSIREYQYIIAIIIWLGCSVSLNKKFKSFQGHQHTSHPIIE